MIQSTDEEILLSLGATEDNFVERKRFSDDREWNRTAVAFANSCPIEDTRGGANLSVIICR
jgi:hypothetical protein